MLQDLCPLCGADWCDGARACSACGFDPIETRAMEGGGLGGGMRGAALALGVLGLVMLSFGAGFQLRSPITAPSVTSSPAVADGSALTRAQLGRVLFAERLGASLELESYRTQFSADDTIAWRAEFLHPPQTSELTVVIAWQSIRERMQLSEATVALRDAELAMVANDEIPVSDLVPTAGLYSVTYFAGETKLAEGVFELLPPDR